MMDNDRNRDLKERTMAFALAIIRAYAGLPKGTVAQVLGKQALRAGTSVGANYREASRARSPAEFAAKVGDCLKEIEETEYWLELLLRSGTIPAPSLDPLREETRQLNAILTSIHKKVRNP
ncbi:MAG: four helix bundle protein [Verrucomicrobiota bacterium]